MPPYEETGTLGARRLKYSDEELFLRVMMITPDTPWNKTRNSTAEDSLEGLALQVLTRVRNRFLLPQVAKDENFSSWNEVLLDIYRRNRRLYPDTAYYRSLLEVLLRRRRSTRQ
jgi:hypothetical protein